MKFISALVTAASGSIRGCTASRNRSGAYLRGRVIPVNPGSPEQSIVRSLLATLVDRWTSVLTPAQRASWILWADNTPQTDALGQAYNMTGQNAYISMNTVRMQTGDVVIDVAPAIFSGTPLTPPILTIADESTQIITFTYNNLDEWANEIGGFLAVYVGRPQNPSVEFFKGPYRWMNTVAGAVVPPVSPATSGPSFPFVAGQRIHVAFRAMTADGRISTQTRSSIIAVP